MAKSECVMCGSSLLRCDRCGVANGDSHVCKTVVLYGKDLKLIVDYCKDCQDHIRFKLKNLILEKKEVEC